MGCVIDDEQHFQINPTLAPVVLNIFNDYLSGKTQKEIRDELNNKGLKNANGREFTINNISKILTNRRYIDNYIYKDVLIENGIPAIIPNDVFDKVQEMIVVNKRAPSRHKAVDDCLLTTKLYCGKCKAFMVGEAEMPVAKDTVIINVSAPSVIKHVIKRRLKRLDRRYCYLSSYEIHR